MFDPALSDDITHTDEPYTLTHTQSPTHSKREENKATFAGMNLKDISLESDIMCPCRAVRDSLNILETKNSPHHPGVLKCRRKKNRYSTITLSADTLIHSGNGASHICLLSLLQATSANRDYLSARHDSSILLHTFHRLQSRNRGRNQILPLHM